MFKNLTLYRVPADWECSLEQIEQALQGAVFAPCAPSQEQAMGWVPPRAQDNAALVESIAGQWIMQLRIETKAVPGDAIRKKADEAAAKIESETGRKPGRKEMRDLKEEAKQALLPTAFAKSVNVLVWLDMQNRTLAVDASTQARVDAVITNLVAALPTLAPALINTNSSPQSAMTAWLSAGEADGGFQIERACELKASDEQRTAIKYNRASLVNDELKAQIQQGMLPVSLALNWQGRLGFSLTEGMQIKKLAFLDAVFEGQRDAQADEFDTDVALATGELSNMVPELLKVLGGELV